MMNKKYVTPDLKVITLMSPLMTAPASQINIYDNRESEVTGDRGLSNKFQGGFLWEDDSKE